MVPPRRLCQKAASLWRGNLAVEIFKILYNFSLFGRKRIQVAYTIIQVYSYSPGFLRIFSHSLVIHGTYMCWYWYWYWYTYIGIQKQFKQGRLRLVGTYTEMQLCNWFAVAPSTISHSSRDYYLPRLEILQIRRPDQRRPPPRPGHSIHHYRRRRYCLPSNCRGCKLQSESQCHYHKQIRQKQAVVHSNMR